MLTPHLFPLAEFTTPPNTSELSPWKMLGLAPYAPEASIRKRAKKLKKRYTRLQRRAQRKTHHCPEDVLHLQYVRQLVEEAEEHAMLVHPALPASNPSSHAEMVTYSSHHSSGSPTHHRLQHTRTDNGQVTTHRTKQWHTPV